MWRKKHYGGARRYKKPYSGARRKFKRSYGRRGYKKRFGGLWKRPRALAIADANRIRLTYHKTDDNWREWTPITPGAVGEWVSYVKFYPMEHGQYGPFARNLVTGPPTTASQTGIAMFFDQWRLRWVRVELEMLPAFINTAQDGQGTLGWVTDYNGMSGTPITVNQAQHKVGYKEKEIMWKAGQGVPGSLLSKKYKLKKVFKPCVAQNVEDKAGTGDVLYTSSKCWKHWFPVSTATAVETPFYGLWMGLQSSQAWPAGSAVARYRITYGIELRNRNTDEYKMIYTHA